MAEDNRKKREVKITYDSKFDHFEIRHPDGRIFAYTFLTSAISVIEGALKPDVS